MSSFRALAPYYEVTKPGIVYGNLMVAGAAFIFGSGRVIDCYTCALMLAGLACVIASACVFNNYADRFLDVHMERTKHRALVVGTIRPRHALIYGGVLIVFGVVLLLWTTPIALGAALGGFVSYVFLYTPLKPRSPYALFVGAVAGAVPPLVGYGAAAGVFDVWAWGLFVFLFVWQLFHFVAIAKFRHAEYTAAGVPLLVAPPKNAEAALRARRIFFYSLWVLCLVCVGLILQRWMR